jgi:hypothetical protein
MKLEQLQKEYIQKSRIFLYPLLNIRRGVSVTPIQTYMTWENYFKVTDYKFIMTYHLRDDVDFKNFEEQKLLGNPLFFDFFELKDGTGAYVFDYLDYKKEYKLIVNGKYSLLPEDYKKKILLFFKNHQKHQASIMSYLEPEKFFKDYAKLLNVSEQLLIEVGELCSLPNLKLESLNIKKKIFNFDSVNNL